jgi:hypothetical protein
MIFPLTSVQTGSGAHPASSTVGTGGSFAGLKRGRSVTLTTHPNPVPRSRMSRSYTSSSPRRLRCVQWDSFSFSVSVCDSRGSLSDDDVTCGLLGFTPCSLVGGYQCFIGTSGGVIFLRNYGNQLQDCITSKLREDYNAHLTPLFFKLRRSVE